MDEVKLKEAFVKIKQDMDYLGSEISSIKLEVSQIKDLIYMILKDKNQQKKSEIPIQPQFPMELENKTNSTYNSTDDEIPTHNPTLPQEIGGLKSQNLSTSTGNRGVPTDRPTDRPTDVFSENILSLREKPSKSNPLISFSNSLDKDIDNASLILESLDSLKKEIRKKFKKITNQEMRVFSSIYQLEEQDRESATYKNIAKKLNLSESSIRDYVQRMCAKGIPLNKEKVNNKQLILSISPNLKKIATLATILQLREL